MIKKRILYLIIEDKTYTKEGKLKVFKGKTNDTGWTKFHVSPIGFSMSPFDIWVDRVDVTSETEVMEIIRKNMRNMEQDMKELRGEA